MELYNSAMDPSSTQLDAVRDAFDQASAMASRRAISGSTYGKGEGHGPSWPEAIDGVDCMAQVIWFLEMTPLRNQHQLCIGSCKIILWPQAIQHDTDQPYATLDHEFEYVDGGAAGSFDPDAFFIRSWRQALLKLPRHPHYRALNEAHTLRLPLPDAHAHASSLRI
jgi:hypothetical protein